MGVFANLSGKQYGRWTVLYRARVVGANTYWWAICSCPDRTLREVRGDILKSGRSQSCGCYKAVRDVERGRSLVDNPRSQIGRSGPDNHMFGVRGDASPHWIGDDVAYAGAHMRVKCVRGRASTHACVDCGCRARDWSLIHGRGTLRGSSGHSTVMAYSTDPQDYEPRCARCHMVYDDNFVQRRSPRRQAAAGDHHGRES